jgi:hypothetical protein
MPYAAFSPKTERERTNSSAGEITNASLRIRSTYVSDMLFDGTLQQGKELSLVEALIQAGADLDFQRNGKGDTPLIGAASLGAEEVGLRLLDAGASPALRGLFGEHRFDRKVNRGLGSEPQGRKVQIPAYGMGDPRLV